MPKLPDVAVFQRYFDATALHQEIAGVKVHNRQVLAEIGPETLAARLKGRAAITWPRSCRVSWAKSDGRRKPGLTFWRAMRSDRPSSSC